MLLTVFTPTYNRAYTLPRLYESLCRQSSEDFEWLVVDDGSTDGTDDLVRGWIQEKRINLSYYYKENGGKPSAYNVGTKVARGELFVCVDSDDYLRTNAVEEISAQWRKDREIEVERNRVIGEIFFRESGGGIAITLYNGNAEYATLLNFYRRHGLQGDTMLVYRSDVVKKYPFPSFEGEKFVPESYVYDQYDDEGVLHMIPKGIYVGEYLSDGLTASMRKVNHDNPKGYEAFINQRIEKDSELKHRFQDMIRYVAIKKVLKDDRLLSDSKHKLLTIMAYLPGWLFYRKAYMIYDQSLCSQCRKTAKEN